MEEIGPSREIEVGLQLVLISIPFMLTDVQAWTAFDFSGRGGQYSAMKWSHEHFTGMS
jgi:hypothetical protein